MDIEPICAHSPQVKGRVERLFQTLQGRLCKTMRLAGIHTMAQANSYLPEYLRAHNARFAVPPQHPQDMHRACMGSAGTLADICALHHQRQLSAQGACKFESRILQLLPGQAHAPKARAMVDIAQHADGTLRLSYCGWPLEHRSHAFADAVPNRQATDHKTLNTKVDKVRDAHQSRLQCLAAEMAFQDSQRKAGIYKPGTPTDRAACFIKALRAAPSTRYLPSG